VDTANGYSIAIHLPPMYTAPQVVDASSAKEAIGRSILEARSF
jgi:hypothetical protein